MPFPLGSASAWCHPCGDLGATPMKVWVPSPRGSGLCHPQGSQSVTPVRLWLVSPPRVSGCHPCHTLFCVTPKGPWFVSPPSGSGWCHSQGSLALPGPHSRVTHGDNAIPVRCSGLWGCSWWQRGTPSPVALSPCHAPGPWGAPPHPRGAPEDPLGPCTQPEPQEGTQTGRATRGDPDVPGGHLSPSACPAAAPVTPELFLPAGRNAVSAGGSLAITNA